MAEDRMTIGIRHAAYLRESVRWFQLNYLQPLLSILREELGNAGIPGSLTVLEKDIRQLDSQTNSGRMVSSVTKEVLYDVSNQLLPVAKCVLLIYRRHLVADTEKSIEMVSSLEVRDNLEKVIEETEMFNNEEWFSQTEPIKTPRLTDYLTLKRVEKILRLGTISGAMAGRAFPVKQYDNKFGVLASPSTLASDLAYWRQQSELRNVGLALAYFDIDDFKERFNTPYNETIVDRQCLPVIARAIETHAFSHAIAYHEGGDEFILLMPNTTKDSAINFMDALRIKMPNLSFPGIESKAHISVGICHVGPDSILTDAEIKQYANVAKTHAKKESGKDCVVTYKGSKYTEDELVTVKPKERAST